MSLHVRGGVHFRVRTSTCRGCGAVLRTLVVNPHPVADGERHEAGGGRAESVIASNMRGDVAEVPQLPRP